MDKFRRKLIGYKQQGNHCMTRLDWFVCGILLICIFIGMITISIAMAGPI